MHLHLDPEVPSRSGTSFVSSLSQTTKHRRDILILPASPSLPPVLALQSSVENFSCLNWRWHSFLLVEPQSDENASRIIAQILITSLSAECLKVPTSQIVGTFKSRSSGLGLRSACVSKGKWKL